MRRRNGTTAGHSVMVPAVTEYRRLRAGDEGSYRHLHLESLRLFPDKFGTRYEDQRCVAELPFERFIKEGCEDNFMCGAFLGQELVAIAGFRRETRPKTRHRGEIVQMFVHPSVQGNGIGDRILRTAVETAFALDGIESVELSLVADNHPAQKLYERVGFRTYGVRKAYFKAGEKYWDQRFMQLFLQDYERM